MSYHLRCLETCLGHVPEVQSEWMRRATHWSAWSKKDYGALTRVPIRGARAWRAVKRLRFLPAEGVHALSATAQSRGNTMESKSRRSCRFSPQRHACTPSNRAFISSGQSPPGL